MTQLVGGLLLAGGLAKRMGGGDKCLIEVAGRPMLAHAIERLAPQVATLALNANGDPARFAEFGLPVLADVVDGHPGPLAGILTGMRWLRRTRPDSQWLVTAAADTPFLPTDLVPRLLAAAGEADIAFPTSAGRAHPTFGLWRLTLAEDLHHTLTTDTERSVNRFAARYRVATATFAAEPGDPFFNVNRPEDLVRIRKMWGR